MKINGMAMHNFKSCLENASLLLHRNSTNLIFAVTFFTWVAQIQDLNKERSIAKTLKFQPVSKLHIEVPMIMSF